MEATSAMWRYVVKPNSFWWFQIGSSIAFTHPLIPHIAKVTYTLHGTTTGHTPHFWNMTHTDRYIKLNSGNLFRQMIWWALMNDLYMIGMSNLMCKHHRRSGISRFYIVYIYVRVHKQGICYWKRNLAQVGAAVKEEDDIKTTRDWKYRLYQECSPVAPKLLKDTHTYIIATNDTRITLCYDTVHLVKCH